MAVVESAQALEARDQALGLLNSGSYAEAEALIRKVCEQVIGQKNEHGQELAQSFMWQRRLVECLVGQGKHPEAEEIARSIHHSLHLRYGPTDEDTLDSQFLLAQSLHWQGKEDEALKLAENAAQGFTQNLQRGPDHLMTLDCQALLALILTANKKYTDARTLAQSTIERLEAYTEKAETRAAQGGRRLNPADYRDMEKVRHLLEKVLASARSCKDEVREASKASASTRAPDDDGMSRMSSKA